MKVISSDHYDVIEISQNEVLTVSSTYEVVKYRYSLKIMKSIKLKIYDNFFVVEYVDKNNKSKQEAFSDTWDFSIL